MSVLYSLRGLTRRFAEREVLHIDRLDVEQGQIYALLGDNGAGKSTLMRILAFLDSPSSGELFFKGRRVERGQEARFRPGVVWLPQFPVMFTGSLLYNVEYPMALRRVDKKQRRQKALDLLETVKLGHLAKAPAHRLSGGESQRAGIARALAAGAEVVLFDEPTANVDQRSVGDFVSLVRGLYGMQALSIFITTHNADLAATLCPRRIFLSEGRVVDKRLLPGGFAWPGRLEQRGAGALLVLPGDARHVGPPASVATRLRGIAELAAGVSIRLEAQDLEFTVLLEDGASKDRARALTLSSPMNIMYSGNAD